MKLKTTNFLSYLVELTEQEMEWFRIIDREQFNKLKKLLEYKIWKEVWEWNIPIEEYRWMKIALNELWAIFIKK